MSSSVQNTGALDPTTTATASTQDSSWDPKTLSPIWADIEIAGLCVALLIECEILNQLSMFEKPPNMNDKYSVTITTNRLQRLINASNASPGFKTLAQQCISDIPTGGKGADDRPIKLRNDLTQGIQNLQVFSNLGMLMTYDKNALKLPNDDGTAMFCLTCLFAGDFLYQNPHLKQDRQEWSTKDYNGGAWVDFFTYETPNGTPAAYIYSLQAYYYLNDRATDKCSDRGTLILEWISQNGGPSIDPANVPSEEQTNADADATWNSYVEQYNNNTPKANPFGPDSWPPFNPSAPNSFLDPYNLGGSGNDVYSKTYLELEWMKDNPDNPNGAVMFTLYLSDLCANADSGAYNTDQFDQFANTLLSIQDKSGKTLVAECVDITMEEIVANGGSAVEAQLYIDELFPGEDPISNAARAEAAQEAGVLANSPPPTQEQINQQWYDYMTEPSTISSIDAAQSAILGDMLNGCGSNIYAALLVLLLLLSSSSIIDIDAEGNLSKKLTDETAQLNTLTTEWNNGATDGWDADSAEAWMDQLHELQDEMNQTPFDSDTMTTINTQFNSIYNCQAMGDNPPQATYPNNQAMYVDSNGEYVNAQGQKVDSNGNPILVNKQPVMGSGGVTPVYCSGDLYVDNSGNTYYKQTNGIYINTQTGADANLPPGSVQNYTIEDQYEAGDYNGLATSFNEFEPSDVNPNNPNQGGFTPQENKIVNSLGALSSPLTAQSSMVGAEMQQIAGYIKTYENAFTSMLTGDSGEIGFESAINNNMRA